MRYTYTLSTSSHTSSKPAVGIGSGGIGNAAVGKNYQLSILNYQLYKNPGNPLNYNKYSYVLNNPLKYTDPSGYSYAYSKYLQQEFGYGSGQVGSFRSHATGNTPHWMTTQYWGSNKPNDYSDYLSYKSNGFRGSYEQWQTVMYEPEKMGGIRYEVSYELFRDVFTDGKSAFVNIYYGYKFQVNSGPQLNTSRNEKMLENSLRSNIANGFATEVDLAIILSELIPGQIKPRKLFDNIKTSTSAGKLISKGNVLLTWTAVAVDGMDLYENRQKATNGDVIKFGVDVGLATTGTILFGIATFVPGVNLVTWGVALFIVSSANTYGVFDSGYELFNNP